MRRFTAELLAALLSIPTSKSLLRRHLNIHYKDLVGKEAMKSKREAEQDPNHQVMLEISANTGAALSQKMLLKLQALTPSAKVKPPSLSQGKKPHQFSLGRRTRKSMSPGGPLIGTSKQTVRKIRIISNVFPRGLGQGDTGTSAPSAPHLMVSLNLCRSGSDLRVVPSL